ncbi:MAG: BrnT family toxin [bacterium]
MVFEEIIWLHYVVEKLAWKHRVVPSEVEKILASRSTRHFRNQKGKIDGEDVYNALGRTQEGRYLSVFYIRKHGHRALIISARNMNKVEK